MPTVQQKNIEVAVQHENGKAVIQGKTSVPFKMFVSLILQRKVQGLFKQWQDEPVIVGSDLLTKLASAPNDSVEDRGKLVAITLAAGVLIGFFCSAALLLVLTLIDVYPTASDLGIILGVLAVIGILVMFVGRLQGPSAKQKIYDKMEKLSDMFSSR